MRLPWISRAEHQKAFDSYRDIAITEIQRLEGILAVSRQDKHQLREMLETAESDNERLEALIEELKAYNLRMGKENTLL